MEQLRWKHEGRNPLSIYEKTQGLAIPQVQFWLKLALLLFDSGYYPQSASAFENVAVAAEVSPVALFAAWTWKGHLHDLQGRREEAVACYRKALELDPGKPMQHSQYNMTIDRRWVEARLRSPFTWGAESGSRSVR